MGLSWKRDCSVPLVKSFKSFLIALLIFSSLIASIALANLGSFSTASRSSSFAQLLSTASIEYTNNPACNWRSSPPSIAKQLLTAEFKANSATSKIGVLELCSAMACCPMWYQQPSLKSFVLTISWLSYRFWIRSACTWLIKLFLTRLSNAFW